MKLIFLLVCICLLPQQAFSLEIEAPAIPEAYEERMPSETGSLQERGMELVRKAVDAVLPDIREASRSCMSIMAAVLLTAVAQMLAISAHTAAEIAGIAAVSVMLLTNTNSMIHLAAETVQQISEYGRLLLPVMATALAAQGGITSSGALYAGTAFVTALLQSAMNIFLIPGVYVYLGLCIGNAATGEELLKQAGDVLKQFLVWCLKLLVILFTTCLSLTRVISGTTDAVALKATKISMSSFIPVVGGILSDASEAVLLSAGMLKNTAGMYGLLAVMALFLHPFLKIAIQYLALKVTGILCGIIGYSRLTGIIGCFGNAMSLLLGMTATSCVMVLISTVCFMKGVG